MPTLFQINTTVNWNSTGCIAEDIGQLAMAAGWESYIAWGRCSGVSRSRLIRIGTRWDVYAHVLATRVFDRHGLASIRATRRLVRRIEEIRPDIIHLHNIHGYYLNFPILFQYLSQCEIPVVWTLHDCWAFTGHCTHFDREGCARWKEGCCECPLIHIYPASLLTDRSSRNYLDKKACFTAKNNLTLVPVSHWLAGEVRSSFLKGKPMRVIHNGVDSNLFSPRIGPDSGLKGQFVILGVASVWTENKGFGDFLQLRKILPEEYVIVLVGLTPGQIRSLPKGIVGIGRTEDRMVLAGFYSMADVFVNLTWEDSFPMVNIEALSCGTPVVTFKTGGSVEALDERTGYVVERGDIQGVAEKIREIERLGQGYFQRACRDRVLRLFDKDDCYKQYMFLYQELLKRP